MTSLQWLQQLCAYDRRYTNAQHVAALLDRVETLPHHRADLPVLDRVALEHMLGVLDGFRLAEEGGNEDQVARILLAAKPEKVAG